MPDFIDYFGSDTPLRTQQRKRPTAAEDLTATRDKPDEPDAGLLGEIGHLTTSGLSRAANLIDVPDAMVRNLATLRNPFAPLFHPTTSEGRVSGREWGRELGVFGPDDTYANFFGGLGLEMLTGPTTYTGIGALTKIGKAAQAGGKLAKGLAPAIRAGERSLFSFGVPGTEMAIHAGTGPTAQKIAGYADTALDAVAKSAPGRTIGGLFHAPFLGAFDETGQKINPALHAARASARQAAESAVVDVLDPIRQARTEFLSHYGEDIAASAGGKWRELQPGEVLQPGRKTRLDVGTGKSHVWEPVDHGEKVSADMASHTFERLFSLQAETGGRLDEALHEFGLDPAKMPAALRTQFTDLANQMQGAADAINRSSLSKGGLGGVLNTPEDFEHFARYGTNREADYARASRAFQTVRGSSLPRSELVGLIPEEIVNRLATDPLARAKNEDDLPRAVGHIIERYGKWLGKGQKLDEAGEQFIPRWAGVGEHAEALVGWAAGHPLRAIFLNPKLDDFARYMRQAHTADATYDVIHDLAAQNLGAVRAGVDLTGTPSLGQPKVLLKDFYRMARMDPERSLQFLAGKTGKTLDELKKMAVPHEIAQAVAASTKFLNDDPQWLGVLGQTIDHLTNWWKANVTLPFPSFAGRNHGSGQYMNLASGLMPTLQHAWRYVQHYREALGMLRQGIDPALEREILTHDVFNPRQLFEGVEPGIYGRYTGAQPSNPLDWRQTWEQAGREIGEQPPLADVLSQMAGLPEGKQLPYADRVPELRGARRVGSFVLGTGAKVNQWVEFLNRVPLYKYLRGEGWTAEAAAAKVKELQIDYSKASFAPFENQVMRRLVPFYAFQRRIAPVILRRLAERPGGLMGQTIRAARLASGDDPSLPDYVRETMSVPNPFKHPQDGTLSYLTGFGLPFEQLLQYASGSPRDMLRESLSQVNPLLKAPLEWGTGQSFFQRGPGGAGRSLDDLDPTLGRTMSNVANRFGAGLQGPVATPDWLEFLVGNSPASRFATTARQFSDPRKSPLDLLLANTTGIRVTDISPAAQDAVLKDRAAELMRSMDAKTFEKIYFPQYVEQQMSPQDLEKAHRLEHLRSILERRAKDRVTAKKNLVASEK